MGLGHRVESGLGDRLAHPFIIDAGAAERDAARSEVERLEDAVGQRKKEAEELEERRARTQGKLIEAERLFTELSELSHSPASVEAERLLRSIRVLARRLPADKADKKFESLK